MSKSVDSDTRPRPTAQVDAEEKRALAQATGLDVHILEYWLGNTRKKARKQAAIGYM